MSEAFPNGGWHNPTPEAPVQAHIDEVTPDGLVSGWFWDPAEPEREANVTLLVDGVPVVTVRAGLYRDDLRAAGKGQGRCAFKALLPWESIDGKAEASVTLRDADSGEPAGARAVLRRPVLLTAEQRIDRLERQLRLLRAELDAAEAKAQSAPGEAETSALFRTVADFFQDLAEGRKPQAASLRTRLDAAVARYPFVPLSAPASPAVTLFVLASGALDPLHQTLQSLHESGADTLAQIAVADLGQGDGEDLALIPALARNVKLLSHRTDQTLHDWISAAATPFIALIGAGIRLGPGWLADLTTLLRRRREFAAATSVVQLAPDAAPVAHLLAQSDGKLVRVPPPRADRLIRIDAIEEPVLLLRRDRYTTAGGLDASYRSLAPQLIDLCLSLRRSGGAIACSLTATAICPEGSLSLLDEIAPGDLARLRQACASTATARAASR